MGKNNQNRNRASHENVADQRMTALKDGGKVNLGAGEQAYADRDGNVKKRSMFQTTLHTPMAAAGALVTKVCDAFKDRPSALDLRVQHGSEWSDDNVRIDLRIYDDPLAIIALLAKAEVVPNGGKSNGEKDNQEN